MANYVTHIAEVDGSKFSDSQNTYLKTHATILHGKHYCIYHTAWGANLNVFADLVKVMAGKPVRVYVYEEDAGQQVGTGVLISGENFENSVKWDKTLSPEAIKNSLAYSELHDKIYQVSKQEKQKTQDLKPEGVYSGVDGDGCYRHYYLAKDERNINFVTKTPSLEGLWNKTDLASKWTPIDDENLARLKEGKEFRDLSHGLLSEIHEVKFGHDFIRFSNGTKALENEANLKAFKERLLEHLRITGYPGAEFQGLSTIVLNNGTSSVLHFTSDLSHDRNIPTVYLIENDLKSRNKSIDALFKARNLFSMEVNEVETRNKHSSTIKRQPRMRL
jgi:hypothetical protein